jgi:hypothetical protein
MTEVNRVLTSAARSTWATRARLEGQWRTPESLYALRFATTEAGEAELAALLAAFLLLIAGDQIGDAGDKASLRLAFVSATQAIDADLRGDLSYSRNRDKTISVRDEVSDVAMMLITALGPDYIYGDQADNLSLRLTRTQRRAAHNCLESICDLTSMAMVAASLNEDHWRVIAHACLLEIVRYQGADFLPSLRARLARKEAKLAVLQ